MLPRPLALTLLALLSLAGCSPADFANLLTPRGGFELRRDVPYGPGPRQSFDLYVPQSPAPGAPLVVFFYGGGWNSGDKGDFLFVAQAFTQAGYPVAIPDYRLYPQVRFPGFVQDGAAAVAAARAHLAGLEGRSRPVALAGHSAGAQIAALLATDERYLRRAGLEPCSSVSGLVGLAGPYDFLPLREERYKRVFPEPVRAASQPIAFVDGREPPMLLLTGTADETVDPGNSRRLAARVAREGGAARAVFYEGIGHVEIIATFARPLRSRSSVVSDVLAFLSDISGAPPSRCR